MTRLQPRTCLLALGIVLLDIIFRVSPAHAHTLDLSTARVELRDGHAEVIAELDLLRALAQTAPEAGNPAQIAMATDADLTTYLTRSRTALEGEAHLIADSRNVQLRLRSFPEANALRLLAAEQAVDKNRHVTMTTLHFESTEPLGDVRDIGLTLPTAFGRALVTFVQPQSQLVQRSGTASFEVLATAPAAAAAPRADSSNKPWAALLAVPLSLLAIIVHVWPRKKALPLPASANEGLAK